MTKNITSAEIKKLLKAGNVIVGKDRVIKNLKIGKLQKILLCANSPEQLEKDIAYYSSLTATEVCKLEFQNDELGTICKKPFSISVLGLLKGASK